MRHGKILVIGSSGQIGAELAAGLRSTYGADQVICSDIRENEKLAKEGPFEVLDVLNRDRLREVTDRHEVKEIYLLAALLSAIAEQKPLLAWQLNMEGLLNVLELAREKRIDKIFWPSSIAVFGPTTPKYGSPQHTITEPGTVYGLSKLAGERWCDYYFNKYGVDVRSLRYPGIIGHETMPGGGTTDYAVHIFHEAVREGKYTCFLREDTCLPMMYMPDAVKATLQLMQCDPEKVRIRSSYNVAGMSFTPAEIAAEIQKHIPEFACAYSEDFRQAIAESWPAVIDDSCARGDWGWSPSFDLPGMVDDMLAHIRVKA